MAATLTLEGLSLLMKHLLSVLTTEGGDRPAFPTARRVRSTCSDEARREDYINSSLQQTGSPMLTVLFSGTQRKILQTVHYSRPQSSAHCPQEGST